MQGQCQQRLSADEKTKTGEKESTSVDWIKAAHLDEQREAMGAISTWVCVGGMFLRP